MRISVFASDNRSSDTPSIAESIQRIGRVAGLLTIAVLVFATLYFSVIYIGSE